MTIRVWEYLDEYAAEKADILDAVETVFESGRLILGDSVKRFEREFAAYCGAAHGVGVDNGTNAVFLSLKALGVGAGDEVITVPNTAVPTVSAIVAAGATPRFVDIDPQTYLMDVSKVEAACSKNTKAIVPVHLYGQCVDMGPLREIASRQGLVIVEDCAQAHGAEHHGARAGSMSDAAAFSFYPTKLLGGFGDGGMVVTSRDEVAARLRRLRFYGMDDAYYSEEDGYNSRLDEVHAEILNRKLARLDGYIESRRAIAERYVRELEGLPLSLPVTGEGNAHAYYLYVVRTAGRDEVLTRLAERGIELNVSYPWPIHTMRGYRYLGYSEGDFPHAEAAAREIFSLPMYPMLSRGDQQAVCDALRDILG